MYLFYIIALGIGTIGVFQTIINGNISDQCSLTGMALLNSFAGLIFMALFTCAVYFYPQLVPESFRIPSDFSIKWWYFLPAISGCAVLILGPLTLMKIGAFPSIVTILAGQIFTAFLWDALAEHVPITPSKIIGLILTAVGAYLSFKSK